ncbi:MAG: GGDEF domain-containing protein [Myxococcota bacterium]|nr:GGDEF domain-containing protein [Myxococcota bacterium]
MKDAIRVLLIDPGAVLTPLLDRSELSDFRWTVCASADVLPSSPERLHLEVGVRVLGPEDIDTFEEWKVGLPVVLQKVSWLLVVEGADESGADLSRRLGVGECLVNSPRGWELRQTIERLGESHRLRASNRELRETIRIMDECQSLTRCLEFDQLYPELLELLLGVLGRSQGLALFPRESPAKGLTVALRGFDEIDTAVIADCVVGNEDVLRAIEPGVKVEVEGPLREALRKAGVRVDSMLAMGLGFSAEEPGLVAVSGDGLPFSDVELTRSASVLRHARVALRNATVYRSAKEHAFIDDVTGVYNIRYFMDICDKELRRSARYSVPLSLLFLDLDQFKRINEELGHVQGSQILNRLCRLLKQHIRQVDTLARYGGDEFAILLVGTDHAEALAIAERIRVAVHSEKFLLGEDSSLDLSLSVGVATCPDHGLDRDQFIEAADRAMFQAKASGRNCVFSVEDLS